MLANARLAMAEYQLALFSHWSICPTCQSSDECDEAKTLPIPKYEMSNTCSDTSQSSNNELFDE
jgi:hypothetical protein